MRRELLELASDLARRSEPFALATVIARGSPISAQVGDMAVVTGAGDFHGWVGGSCTRPTVIAEALKSLGDGRPRLVALAPDPESYRRPGLSVFRMTCHSGGSVEIHIQPVLPAPHLVVYGASPTAQALARLGTAMGYRVHAVDPEADSSAFPGVETLATDPDGVRIEKTSVPICAVVATQGQWDEQAIIAALAHTPDYLGVLASTKRFAEMRAWLADKAPEAALSRIKNPAGLDIGAQSPEEIALSILAEIVTEQRHAARAPARQTARTDSGLPAPVPASPAPPATETRDPVCGMTVQIQSTAHRALHEGREFFFCCSGCKQRFLATPERYLGTGTPPR
jgi:xanthine dehydrogenase accessory factor